MNKPLLIVYHSQSGTSARYAWAALQGAGREPGSSARLLRACDADTSAVAEAGGLLLVAAENSGSLAGGMKDFLDRVFYPLIARGVVIPYGLVVSAGNDGRGAAGQTGKILSGIPLKPVSEPLILRGELRPDYLAACADTGQAMAAGLLMGIF